MHHLHLYLPALLVSAVTLWILGAVWYSPALFAKPWMEIVGRPKGEKPEGILHGMISSFIGDLLLALVLQHLVLWSNADSLGRGLFIGFLCWLGFFAATAYPQRIYEGRPLKYFLINQGYWLVGLLIVGPLLAIWR